MNLAQKRTRAAEALARPEGILQSDPKSVVIGEEERRMMKIRTARSVRKPLRNAPADSSNLPRATRTSNMRTKKKMLVPL